jgi:hypothetical protein
MLNRGYRATINRFMRLKLSTGSRDWHKPILKRDENMKRFYIDLEIEFTDKRQNKRIERKANPIDALTHDRAVRFTIDDFLLKNLPSGTNIIRYKETTPGG